MAAVSAKAAPPGLDPMDMYDDRVNKINSTGLDVPRLEEDDGFESFSDDAKSDTKTVDEDQLAPWVRAQVKVGILLRFFSPHPKYQSYAKLNILPNTK